MKKKVAARIKSSISAKQYGFEEIFAPLVAKACVQVLPKSVKNFNVDDVRVAKIVGGGIGDATVIKGVVVTRDSEGTIKEVSNAKVAVYQSGFDVSKTDMKGTVFIEKASELETYSRTEEDSMDEKIQAIAKTGVTLVVMGGTISEMAMHFFERYHIMVIKSASKFELRRICLATGSTGLLSLAPPIPEEMGFISSCKVVEIGSTKVTIFNSDKEFGGISTLILRGATTSILDDIERAITDAVNVFKGMTKESSFVPGAGATELEIAKRLRQIGDSCPGQDQYALKKYSEVFEIIPRTLAECAGMNSIEAIATLNAKHEGKDGHHFGVNAEGGIIDATSHGIFDHMFGKLTAIRLATDTAVNILRIDQIIMSRPAGMPMPGGGGGSGTMGSMDGDDT